MTSRLIGLKQGPSLCMRNQSAQLKPPLCRHVHRHYANTSLKDGGRAIWDRPLKKKRLMLCFYLTRLSIFYKGRGSHYCSFLLCARVCHANEFRIKDRQTSFIISIFWFATIFKDAKKKQDDVYRIRNGFHWPFVMWTIL